MSTDNESGDGIDWPYMVRHMAKAARDAKARADAAHDARDRMIRDCYAANRMTQVDLAKAAGISQPTVAKIVRPKPNMEEAP